MTRADGLRVSALCFSISLLSSSIVHAQGVEAPSAAKSAAFADAEPEPGASAPPVASGNPAPAPLCPPAAPCPSCPLCPQPSVTRSEDFDAVFRAYQVHAEEERSRRYAGGAFSILIGGTTMAVGSVLADSAGLRPDPWLIMGGVSVGIGVLTLVMPSASERTAAQHRAAQSGHSEDEARAFEAAWAKGADEARGSRLFGSIFSLVLGGAGAGIGGAILGGAITMSEPDRYLWGGILTSAGVGIFATGMSGLFIPTSLESSYAAFKASRPLTSSSLSLSMTPNSGGFSLGLGGRF